MKWITRKNIKVDRVACPWLIRRFVDPQAEFLFVEEKDLFEQAKQQDAIPFDAPKIDAIKLNHRGPRCTFEAIVEDYKVGDPAVSRLALIVRAADVKGQESVAAEGIGLRAIAQGFAAMGLSDEDRLARQFPVYDALYAYVQTPGKVNPRPHRDLALINAAGFLRSLGVGFIGVVLGIHLFRVGFSSFTIGLVIASGLAGSALATILATLVADRFGRWRFLLVLSLLGAVGGPALALSVALPVLLIMTFIGMLNGTGTIVLLPTRLIRPLFRRPGCEENLEPRLVQRSSRRLRVARSTRCRSPDCSATSVCFVCPRFLQGRVSRLFRAFPDSCRPIPLPLAGR
jgi:hypothetical protein